MIGLDFGTTNSAVALVGRDGAPRLASFDEGGGRTSVFRSVLYVDPEAPGRNGMPPRFSAGPAAIRDYLATGQRGRLVQSIKSHLASRLFTTTNLFGVQYRLEDLIARLVDALRVAAEADVGPLGRAVVCGRPARFSGATSLDDDVFAEGRLRAALALAGFDDVVFEYEPVAAAFGYRRRLDHAELVLIADFGGGTSDFSLVRLSPSDAAIVVDTVFLTGGSAFVPAVRRLFEVRFGAERLRGGDELTTVATGLALRAHGA
jgi:hypothetical chaperone protein